MARTERKGWKEEGRKRAECTSSAHGQMKGKEKREGKHLAGILQVHRREARGRTQFNEKQLSSDPLCKLALLGSSHFLFFLFFFFSPLAASRNTEKSIECFGVRIDRQSRSVPILTTCVLFMVFTVENCLGCSKNKDVPKECFVLCTHSSTNFNFMSLKKKKGEILTTRVQYFID